MSAAARFYFSVIMLTAPIASFFASFVSLAAMLGALGCAGAEPECAAAADCGDVEAAPCERCSVIARDAVCIEGSCAELGAADVDVSATFLVDRDLDGVNGMAWAIAVADRPCAALSSFDDDLNALASGQKTLAGGDFHPDVPLAPVPAGRVLILALATSGAAGEGDVLGSGCVEADAAAPALSVAQVDLR